MNIKLRNIGSKVKHAKVGGVFIAVKPFEVADLPECLLVNEEGWAKADDDNEGDEEDESKEEEKLDENGKYSKTDLVDMKIDQQVKILKDFGVTNEEIKKLKNEESRVGYILKLQK